MPKRHYTIYSDESSKKGRYFANFYGGAIFKTSNLEALNKILKERKDELNLFKELKWTKITENYADKYIGFISTYFDLLEAGRIRLRIMFTHNQLKAKNLTDEHHENQYFILYYQFFKHAFGLAYSNPSGIDRIFVTLLLDQVPQSGKKFNDFKDFISKLNGAKLFFRNNIIIQRDQIAEVKSDDHVILQGLDIILGAMQFRLNDHHKEKPEGSKRRGRRTIAKEKVYKYINSRIRVIYPQFNVRVSTGTPNGLADRWQHPYRHWKFVPKDFELDITYVKNKTGK